MLAKDLMHDFSVELSEGRVGTKIRPVEALVIKVDSAIGFIFEGSWKYKMMVHLLENTNSDERMFGSKGVRPVHFVDLEGSFKITEY